MRRMIIKLSLFVKKQLKSNIGLDIFNKPFGITKGLAQLMNWMIAQ
jgi:hypothetical protein